MRHDLGWRLDPSVTYLNHGSFGACPEPVLQAQQAWRDRMERQPVAFLDRALPGLLDEVRARLAPFLGADAEGIAWVPNATTGVNAVLRSLRFRPGDEILTTDHEYNATLNTVAAVASRDGARVVIARLPFPAVGSDAVADAVLAGVTPRTRLVVLSHVTSPTALVLPVERLVPALRERGVETLVDGAHAPGMVPLDLEAMGVAYYTGNAHKWLCAPKGSGFLWVRSDRREAIRPTITSHGANDRRRDRARYLLEFDWVGTADPTPYLSIPVALDAMGSMDPGGWPAVMAANHELAVAASRHLASVLRQPRAAPEDMLGSMAAVPLPGPASDDRAKHLQSQLVEARIEAPVVAWPVPAARGDIDRPELVLVRVSAQRYVELEDVERLGARLQDMLQA